MIRRTDRDGHSQHWLLISQIEHAKVAARLAENWQGLLLNDPGVRSDLLAAIYTHDDGWADWERAPELDSIHGRPLDFTEMPLATSLAIWQESINLAVGRGPLAALVVSGHFCAMLARSSENRERNDRQRRLVDGFLARNRPHHARWLAEWRGDDPSGRTAELARECLGILQSFDALSLWFCCGPPSDPFPFNAGEDANRPVVFQSHGDNRVAAGPWPLTAAALEIQISAQQVPVRQYRDSAALLAASTPAMIRISLSSGNEAD